MSTFKLIPLTINFSKFDGYGINIMGFQFNNREMAIGFNFYKNKYWEKDVLNLSMFAYGAVKRIPIKVYPKSHYRCKYCNTPVSPNDHWCSKCDEDMMEDEVIFNAQ